MSEQVQNPTTTAPPTTQNNDSTNPMKRNLNESQSTDTATQDNSNNVGPPQKKQKLNETEPNTNETNNNNNNNNNVDNSQNNQNPTQPTNNGENVTSGPQPMQVDQQQQQQQQPEQKVEEIQPQQGRYLTRTFQEIRKYLKTLPAEHLRKLAGDTILMQKESFQTIRERMHLHPNLCKIFVRSLSYDTKEETVKNFFLQYGEIKEVCIVKDRDTGTSRGFGFITYKNADMAIECLREHCKIIDNREVICNLAAKPQGQKDKRRGGRYNNRRGGRRRRGRGGGRRRHRGGFDEPMFDNQQQFFNTTYPGQPMQPMPPMPQMQPPVHMQMQPMQPPMQMQPMQMQPMQPMQQMPMQPMQMQGPM